MPGGSSTRPAVSDQNGQDWADILDFLTMHPEARRKVARFLAEIDAADQR
jgi:hypothetical protein